MNNSNTATDGQMINSHSNNENSVNNKYNSKYNMIEYQDRKDQLDSLQYPSFNDEDFMNEIIFEEETRWVPIQLYKRNMLPCWTHFLTRDRKLSSCKCKHCGNIIRKSFNIVNNNNNHNNNYSTKRFKEHLINEHKINSNINYYIYNAKKKKFMNIKNVSKSQTATNKKLNKEKIINEKKSHHYNHFQNKVLISNDLIISILIASQNLPLSFVNNSSFLSLLKSIPEGYHIKEDDIKDNIIDLSTSIELFSQKIIQSKFPLTINKSSFNLNIENDTSNDKENDMANNIEIDNDDNNILKSLNEILYDNLQYLKINPIFSLTFHIWNDKFFVISAQFFDPFSNDQKTFPLSVTQINKQIDKIDENYISERFIEVFNRYNGLTNITLSITLPNQKLCKNLRFLPYKVNNANNNALPDIQVRSCLLSDLLNSTARLFGHKKSSSYDLIFDNEFSKNNSSSDIINSLLDISCIDITTSIFGKINAFFDEINTDINQVDLFTTICQELNYKIPSLKKFNPNYPSNAIDFLQKFTHMKKIIEKLNPSLQVERFTESDFQIVNHLILLLKSLYSIMINLTSSNINYFICSHQILYYIELQINHILKDVQHSRFLRQFQIFLLEIKEIQKNLSSCNSSLVASFLSPNTLANPKLLEFLYHSTSIQTITDKVSELSLALLNKYFKTKSMQNTENETQESPATNESNNDTMDDPLMEGLPFFELGGGTCLGNDEVMRNKTFLDAINNLLTQEIENNLNNYFGVIQSEYLKFQKNYLIAYGYEKTNSGFKKISSISTEILSPLEELEQIHIPLGGDFLEKYLSSEVGFLFKIITKILFTESISSIRKDYMFLNGFTSAVEDDLLEPCLKIRLLNSQFDLEKIDLNNISFDEFCSLSL